MTNWRFDRPTGRLAILLAAVLLAHPPAIAAEAGDPASKPGPEAVSLLPYEARYAIYRNGRLTGKLEVALERHGDRWIIRSSGSGTHGLARILAASDSEQALGRLLEGRFRPDFYTRHTRWAGIDDRWKVEFDWTARRVGIQHDRHDTLWIQMIGDSLDPLSLKLEMRQRLRRAGQDLRFHMVEEDEIDEQIFRRLPGEWLETSLGCLLTIPVEKIRHESKRYTRAWHAPDLGFVEVRMEHGKTGGSHHEVRITELALDDIDIVPRPGCAARQSGGSGPGGRLPDEER